MFLKESLEKRRVLSEVLFELSIRYVFLEWKRDDGGISVPHQRPVHCNPPIIFLLYDKIHSIANKNNILYNIERK